MLERSATRSDASRATRASADPVNGARAAANAAFEKQKAGFDMAYDGD
jgi:hypothetical protein